MSRNSRFLLIGSLAWIIIVIIIIIFVIPPPPPEPDCIVCGLRVPLGLSGLILAAASLVTVIRTPPIDSRGPGSVR